MMKTTVLCSLSLSLLVACSRKSQDAFKYETYSVERVDLVRYVESDGSLETEKSIEVLPPVDGRLEKLYVKEGDRVYKGQLIGTMSSNTRSAILDVAGSKTAEDRAYWEKQMLPTRIFSPTRGKVIDIRSYEGENIRGALMSISTGLVIRSNVDESDLPQIALEQPVKIVFDIVKNREIEGKVTSIKEKSRIVNNVNVYPVEVGISEKDLDALPFETKIGMSVTLHFKVEEKKQARAIASKAFGGKSRQKVKAFDEAGTPIELVLGEEYGDYVELRSELPDGAKFKVRVKVRAKDDAKVPFFMKK